MNAKPSLSRYVAGPGFYAGTRPHPNGILYRIRRQVLAEYGPQLRRATGWRRAWLKCRLHYLIRQRYGSLLFTNCADQRPRTRLRF